MIKRVAPELYDERPVHCNNFALSVEQNFRKSKRIYSGKEKREEGKAMYLGCMVPVQLHGKNANTSLEGNGVHGIDAKRHKQGKAHGSVAFSLRVGNLCSCFFTQYYSIRGVLRTPCKDMT